MVLPIILSAGAAIAGIAGLGSSIRGGKKMKNASQTMKLAREKQENAVNTFNWKNERTVQLMDEIGRRELHILSTFDDFSDIIEKIQGRPQFKEYKRDGIDLPQYEAEELKRVSAGAGVLLGGMGAAAAGTAGGFAAAGATTSAVVALGTASTGTAISSLTGVAATNATLAALGGGSLAAHGGGVALGATVLGGASLGVGLLIGGIIFNVAGSKLSNKADEAYLQAVRTEIEVDRITEYLDELSDAASKFYTSLRRTEDIYLKYLGKIDALINQEGKINWVEYSDEEKKTIENAILLVGVMYMMCKVKLVIQKENGDELNKVNKEEIDDAIDDARRVIEDIEN